MIFHRAAFAELGLLFLMHSNLAIAATFEENSQITGYTAIFVSASSEYSSSYAGQFIEGEPDSNKWSPGKDGRDGPEFFDTIEFRTPSPVLLLELGILEAIGAGSAVNVSAQSPEGDWVSLFEAPVDESRSGGDEFRPPLQRAPFLASSFRVGFVWTSSRWIEVDSLSLTYLPFACDFAQLQPGNHSDVACRSPAAGGAPGLCEVQCAYPGANNERRAVLCDALSEQWLDPATLLPVTAPLPPNVTSCRFAECDEAGFLASFPPLPNGVAVALANCTGDRYNKTCALECPLGGLSLPCSPYLPCLPSLPARLRDLGGRAVVCKRVESGAKRGCSSRDLFV